MCSPSNTLQKVEKYTKAFTEVLHVHLNDPSGIYFYKKKSASWMYSEVAALFHFADVYLL